MYNNSEGDDLNIHLDHLYLINPARYQQLELTKEMLKGSKHNRPLALLIWICYRKA
jgi:hypothetical protein